ncbi:coil containing protein [Vibrio phage 1.187.O._10N.286.49.F1]|nr:coil containing protein [Vibrio phage 1.187.O._10N.286.49.F1]
MKKVLFVTSLQSAGTGIICNEDYSDPMFVAVNHVAGSAIYGFFMDGNVTNSGITYTSAAEAWEGLAEYLLADHVLPVGQPQIKKWFKEEYNSKLKEFKYNLSDEKRAATEQNKIKKKTQSGGLWLKAKSGIWN